MSGVSKRNGLSTTNCFLSIWMRPTVPAVSSASCATA